MGKETGFFWLKTGPLISMPLPRHCMFCVSASCCSGNASRAWAVFVHLGMLSTWYSTHHIGGPRYVPLHRGANGEALTGPQTTQGGCRIPQPRILDMEPHGMVRGPAFGSEISAYSIEKCKRAFCFSGPVPFWLCVSMAWGISTPRPKPDLRLIKSQTPGAGSCAQDDCFSFLKSLWVIVKAKPHCALLGDN